MLVGPSVEMPVAALRLVRVRARVRARAGVGVRAVVRG
jgi:hypothetical protein